MDGGTWTSSVAAICAALLLSAFGGDARSGGTLDGSTTDGSVDGFVALLDGSADGGTSDAHTRTDDEWTLGFGGPGIDEVRGIGVDASGNVYVAGLFEGAVSFEGEEIVSAGLSDIFVLALNRDGSLRWLRRFGGERIDHVESLAVGLDGTLVLGGAFTSDALDFGGDTLRGAGATDAFVAKLSSTGAHEWSHRFGDHVFQSISGVALASDGRVAVGGSLSGTIDFDGGTLSGNSIGFAAVFDADGGYLWSDDFDSRDRAQPASASAVAFSAEGDLFVMGTIAFGTASPSIHWGAYDDAGSSLWRHDLQGGLGVRGLAIVADASGNAYGGGATSGSVDFDGVTAETTNADAFVARRSASGGFAWVDHAGGTNPDAVTGLALLGDEVVAVAELSGTFELGGSTITTEGGRDVVAVVYGTAGTPRLVRQLRGTSGEEAPVVAADGTDTLLIAGSYGGSGTTLDGVVLPGSDSNNVFITRLKL